MVLDFKVNRKIGCRDDNQFFYAPNDMEGRPPGSPVKQLDKKRVVIGFRRADLWTVYLTEIMIGYL